jgi:hypothetical protein
MDAADARIGAGTIDFDNRHIETAAKHLQQMILQEMIRHTVRPD